jgi:hypothetical protein
MGANFLRRNSARLGVANSVAVATTSTSVASAAFGSETWQIRIAASAGCFYKVDYAPTAAATDAYLPPNWVEYVKVSPSQKVSVFSSTIQTVSVVEVTE